MLTPAKSSETRFAHALNDRDAAAAASPHLFAKLFHILKL